MSIIQFLKSQGNSFDSLLFDYNNNDPIYPCIVLATPGYFYFRDAIPCLFDVDNGFYLKRDSFIPNLGRNDDSKNTQLYLKKTLAYSSTYEDDKHIGLTYTFFSKTAINKIYSYFEEGEEAFLKPPFWYTTFCKLHNIEPKDAEDENVRKGAIFKEDIIGMVSLESTYSDKKLGLFVLLLRRPIPNEDGPQRYDMYEAFDFQKVYFKSIFLKSYTTKLLVWAFIHDLKEMSPWCNERIMNDEEKTLEFIEFLKSHYDGFSDEQKNECLYILSEKQYQVTPTLDVYRELAIYGLMSMAINVRKWGIGGSYAVVEIAGNKEVKELMERTVKVLFGNTDLIFDLPQEYQFPLIIDLVFVNLMYFDVDPVHAPTGYWLYYLLYKYRNNCSKEELPLINTLLVYALKNNMNHFSKIFKTIKREVFEYDFENKGFWGPKIAHMKDSWSNCEDKWCISELIYHFSDGCKSQWENFSEEEKQLWIKRLDNELEYDEFYKFFQGDGRHTVIGMEKQREYYAESLFQYIKNEIFDNNNPAFKGIYNNEIPF